MQPAGSIEMAELGRVMAGRREMESAERKRSQLACFDGPIYLSQSVPQSLTRLDVWWKEKSELFTVAESRYSGSNRKAIPALQMVGERAEEG
jgi:hypothetical protein